MIIVVVGFVLGYQYYQCECSLINCRIERGVDELRYEIGTPFVLESDKKVMLMAPDSNEYFDVEIGDDVTSELNRIRIYEQLNRTLKND